jgi:hypothetical protein
MDPTTRASGYTIPDADPFVYYLIANSGASASSVTLPHATARGRIIQIFISTYQGAPFPALTVLRQGTDTIRVDGANSNATSLNVGRSARFVSDGAGHWLLNGAL